MAKTLSFAVMHYSIAFTVAWVITGSLLVGGLVALVEPAVNTLAFHFHEKLWLRMQTASAPAQLTRQRHWCGV
jgi:uncharacterized membrane protein